MSNANELMHSVIARLSGVLVDLDELKDKASGQEWRDFALTEWKRVKYEQTIMSQTWDDCPEWRDPIDKRSKR